MLDSKFEYRVSVLLALQQALLGQIVPEIRAIACEWNNTNINIRVIFYRTISDENFETVDEIGSEVASNFHEQLVNVESIVVKQHILLNKFKLDEWFFIRKED